MDLTTKLTQLRENTQNTTTKPKAKHEPTPTAVRTAHMSVC